MMVDIRPVYRQMLRMRYFEEALEDLWHRGLISGEMHSGKGEEAVVAGVLAHLEEGDALALDHRSTPPLVARGVDLVSLLLEMMGEEDGLCGGWGGHMHLFSRPHLAASSGIVGSSAPLAAGFALAAQCLNPGKVAFSFFGDGAVNQGMLLEALNLAVAWKLPVVFVCKDNRWAITTRTSTVTGGCLLRRARSFGMPVWNVDGTRVEEVYRAASAAVGRARRGRGPSFILARCPRMEGHFLGDPLLRVFRDPLGQGRMITPPLVRALFSKPVQAVLSRLTGLGFISRTLTLLGLERYLFPRDPLQRTAALLEDEERGRLEEEAGKEVREAVAAAMERRGENA